MTGAAAAPQPLPVQVYADLANNWVVPLLFLFIVIYGWARKVKMYEVFVEGAKEGFNVAVMIIPYLVAILCAIAIFRSSGALDFVAKLIGYVISPKAMPPEAVMLSLIKPLSGSGARGFMLDIFQRYGVDSYPGFLASAIQGSTETTFYVCAVYFGAVGVKQTRHTIPVGLFAEFVAIVVSVFVASLWYQAPK
jgi:spore maturation protein B